MVDLRPYTQPLDSLRVIYAGFLDAALEPFQEHNEGGVSQVAVRYLDQREVLSSDINEVMVPCYKGVPHQMHECLPIIQYLSCPRQLKL
jgi:hypothetical protein